MAKERPADSTYWDDSHMVGAVLTETGRAQLQLQCYEYGIPWEKDEKNAVLKKRLRKAGVPLPEDQTLEELEALAAERTKAAVKAGRARR